MKRHLWRLASSVLVVLLAIGSPGQGQVSAIAAQDVRPAQGVLLEARVLSVPHGALGPLGLSELESGASAPSNLKSFLIPLAQEEVRSLAENPGTKTVHQMTLHATHGNRSQFRIDTRVPGNSSADAETYFLVGIGLEATPTVRSDRVVSLMTGSIVQIRRGPPTTRGVVPLLFESPLTRHEIQVPDGMTILLGGFVASSNVPAVPEMASVPGNPILNYILSKGPKKEDDPEIVVMLTPRLPGTVEPVVPPVPAAPKPRLPITSVPTPSPEIPAAPTVAIPAMTSGSVMPNPPFPVTPALAPSANLDFPTPLSAPPAAPATPKVLIPGSVASSPPTKADLPVPVTARLTPSSRFDLPTPGSALPAPAVTPKVLIPASVASAPPTKADLPVPIIVTLAPSARFELPGPVSPPPPPVAQAKALIPSSVASTHADFPILVSAVSAPSANSNLLSIASVSPTKPSVPVPISVSLAASPTLDLPVPVSPPPGPVNYTPGPDATFHAVQVGAFRDRHRAETLVVEMEKRFGKAFIATDTTLRTPYRVRVGHAPNLAQARQLQRRLRSMGFDSFVIFPIAN